LNIGYDRLSEEKLGFRVLSAGRDCVEWERRTTETYIKCKIESGLRREWRINTGINLEVESSRYKLLHTINEDSGITLVKAFYLLALERIKEYGIRGFGFGRCILDEAYSEARISFEGRVGCWMMRNLESEKFMFVEDIHEESIKEFFEGFTQGMRVTIHIELLRGKDPHHLWESVFRSLGESFRQALTKNEWRKGSVAGVEKPVD
jgi:imidazoleglycerol-phosphate dehydratase